MTKIRRFDVFVTLLLTLSGLGFLLLAFFIIGFLLPA